MGKGGGAKPLCKAGYNSASCILLVAPLPPRTPIAMALSLDDVQRIAHLARIEITPVEAEDVQRKLGGIFGLIEEMQKVDTAGVEPMAHAQEVTLPLREDTVSEGDQHALFQSIAPEVEHGLYLVPRVIE